MRSAMAIVTLAVLLSSASAAVAQTPLTLAGAMERAGTLTPQARALTAGEAEAIVILEGPVELHGASGIMTLEAGDVVFIPPDTEHGLRTPGGGRWLAVWPTGERRRGPRYGP